eukprot:1265533-Pleurochrysis_carterae.AAC.2
MFSRLALVRRPCAGHTSAATANCHATLSSRRKSCFTRNGSFKRMAQHDFEKMRACKSLRASVHARAHVCSANGRLALC